MTHLRKILVAGGNTDIVASLRAKLEGCGLEVAWHASEVGDLPDRLHPSCEMVYVIRDMASHSLSDKAKILARGSGAHYLCASHRWSVLSGRITEILDMESPAVPSISVRAEVASVQHAPQRLYKEDIVAATTEFLTWAEEAVSEDPSKVRNPVQLLRIVKVLMGNKGIPADAEDRIQVLCREKIQLWEENREAQKEAQYALARFLITPLTRGKSVPINNLREVTEEIRKTFGRASAQLATDTLRDALEVPRDSQETRYLSGEYALAEALQEVGYQAVDYREEIRKFFWSGKLRGVRLYRADIGWMWYTYPMLLRSLMLQCMKEPGQEGIREDRVGRWYGRIMEDRPKRVSRKKVPSSAEPTTSVQAVDLPSADPQQEATVTPTLSAYDRTLRDLDRQEASLQREIEPIQRQLDEVSRKRQKLKRATTDRGVLASDLAELLNEGSITERDALDILRSFRR